MDDTETCAQWRSKELVEVTDWVLKMFREKMEKTGLLSPHGRWQKGKSKIYCFEWVYGGEAEGMF